MHCTTWSVLAKISWLAAQNIQSSQSIMKSQKPPQDRLLRFEPPNSTSPNREYLPQLRGHGKSRGAFLFGIINGAQREFWKVFQFWKLKEGKDHFVTTINSLDVTLFYQHWRKIRSNSKEPLPPRCWRKYRWRLRAPWSCRGRISWHNDIQSRIVHREMKLFFVCFVKDTRNTFLHS